MPVSNNDSTMNSAISTDLGLRPWQLFLLAGMLAVAERPAQSQLWTSAVPTMANEPHHTSSRRDVPRPPSASREARCCDDRD